MGTQQILMIVLSVIVVGAAVAVGIQMFDTQATNAQRQALAADMQNFSSQVLANWRTPKMMGGAGQDAFNEDNLLTSMGFSKVAGAGIPAKGYANANGRYVLSLGGGEDAKKVTIIGWVPIADEVVAPADNAAGLKAKITAVIDAAEPDPTKAITITFNK